MTIYLITELYPVDERDTSITHAVRDFADTWNAEVLVFRPLQLRLSSISRMGKYCKLLRASPKQLGKRKVVFFLLFKIPFLRKYIYWIRDRQSYPAPTILVGHSLIGNYLAHHLAKLYRIPFSIGLHNYDIFNFAKEKKQYEKIFEHCGLIACRSQNILNRLNDLTRKRFEHKSFVAHSGIEEDQVEDLSLFVSKAKELHTRPVRFITAARLDGSKNIDINIEVLASLQQDFSYTIIGEGAEHRRLQKQIDRNGLSDKIVLTGWKDHSEVLKQLRQADIFLMISAPETFGLAYLEAMAKACIVIGAIGWGIDGIIKNGQNGYLAEPGNGSALSKVIHEILNLSPVQREKIARASRATVLELTRQKAADAYLAQLKHVLEDSERI
jgi:glycosyltransferase involved in cell wall biosynthesis